MSNVKYIEYLHPGVLVSETSMVPLIDGALPKIHPKDSFGYRTLERTEIIEDDGDFLTGQWKNQSPWTYFGKILTLEEIPDNEENHILRLNMINNGYDRVVRTKFGQAIELRENDVVIDE